MMMRVLVLVAMLTTAVFAGPAAAWFDAGHEPCMTAEAMGSAPCDWITSQSGPVADTDAEGCAVMSACSAVPGLAGDPAPVSGLPSAAAWAPVTSDQVPAGRTSEPLMEPPIIGV